ncbi:PD-(D/E)XK nuclease family protein [Natronococcus wangiae]|uniref:PD-(D/E)XK nuclease family protein n=1 Tax=Natronococcus wangiae TaxID=3068275 RepID=UPI00273FEC9B|nr:PD-(D/E)XK nuclease family protein [Natronococcus sp. AD5]
MTDDGVPTLSADGLETYLHCPRRYEFAHVHDLERGDDERSTRDRVDLLRTALCDALRSGETDAEELGAAASNRLSELWRGHDERFHSRAQRRHERTVLEATLEAYLERFGVEHAAGIDRLEASTPDGEFVGPDRPLASTRPLSDSAEARTSATQLRIDAPVDYVYGDGAALVGVRFVQTLAPLGFLRYRSEWEGDVASLFVDHFDPGTETFEPRVVGALFETAVVLDGLRNLRDDLELGDRTCRYVQLPLADRSGTAVNWVQDTVEASIEPIDLTDVYVDHHTYGMTHEHRNETVDSRLVDVAGDVVAESFDPSAQWEEIETHACSDCGYTVCCQDHLAAEVRFDG